MQGLFSFLFILSCLHLLSFVKADDPLAAALCDATTKSLHCANLGNISYPFGDVAPCAESDSFSISGCSSDQAYWDVFTKAFSSDLGAPAVTGIFGAGYLNFINLTWNLPLSEDPNICNMLSVDRVNTDIPGSIDLTSFANGSFQLSSYNCILLLNCSKLPPSSLTMQLSSTICQNYVDHCGLPESTPCAQIIVPTKQLMLQDALEKYSCTHFQFLVSAHESTPTSSWKQGLVQLFYGDAQCEACYSTGGKCFFDKVNTHVFQECSCGNNTYSDTDCLHIRSKNSCSGFKCNTGAKIAVGVASTVAGTVIAVLLVLWVYYRKNSIVALNYHKKTKNVPFRSAKKGSNSLIIRHLDLDWLTERPIEYQYASMVLATKSFSNLLGQGGFGAVYRGTLQGDAKEVDAHVLQIAVKVLEARSKHSKDQFFNEVGSIGRIHHVHVVRLLGFCLEENHEMLVYEYVINGSLDKWLFHCSDNHNRVLLWEQRYAIAIGMAKGLSYLHEECRHRIVHCDIKPQNILLDEQMRPKIADFGLARLMGREESRVVTLARGTPGYMGPEFWLGGESQLSTKFDVYSYGMVLLELISGQRNFGHGVYFPETAFEAAMGGNFESIMDVKLGIAKASDGECIILQDDMQRQQVQTALLVALWCIQDHPKKRPSMSEVVQYLEGTAAVNEQPPRPTIASHIISISAQAQHSYLSNDLHYDDITPVSGGR